MFDKQITCQMRIGKYKMKHLYVLISRASARIVCALCLLCAKNYSIERGWYGGGGDGNDNDDEDTKDLIIYLISLGVSLSGNNLGDANDAFGAHTCVCVAAVVLTSHTFRSTRSTSKRNGNLNFK